MNLADKVFSETAAGACFLGKSEQQGVRLRKGTIVNATVIEAPSSTKNRAGQRDPKIWRVKKGNQSSGFQPRKAIQGG